MSYETADILDSAADKIEREGWWQGGDDSSEEQQSGSCAYLAITDSDSPKKFTAARVLAAHIGVAENRDIWAWNDAPERTQQEVLDALRGAAKAERRAADEVSA